MQNIPACRRTWNAEDEVIVFQFHIGTSWTVRGAHRRAGQRSAASQRAHGLGQGMVWAVPLWRVAGPPAVRTGAQMGKHLRHTHDKEPLAYIKYATYNLRFVTLVLCLR
jgi:hypothetical protein